MMCNNPALLHDVRNPLSGKVVSEVFDRLCPTGSVDQLICNPVQAIQYCNAVRQETGDRYLDRAILRTLVQVRKSGFVSDC